MEAGTSAAAALAGEEAMIRMCTAAPCTNPLPAGRIRYCSEKCIHRAASARRRATDWGSKGVRHPRTAEMWEMRRELDAEGGKGRCIFCVRTLPPLRHLHCGRAPCEAEYQHMYHLAEMTERAATRTPPVAQPCGNGCGGFTRMGGNGRMTRFCSERCQRQFNWLKASRDKTAMRMAREKKRPAYIHPSYRFFPGLKREGPRANEAPRTAHESP